MSDLSLGCAFTGHRKIEDSHLGKIEPLVMRAIEYAYGEGCRKFYTGGALGFDTVAAKAVILFRLRHPDAELHIIVPCAEQSAAWSDEECRMYDYLLGEANSVSVLEDGYTADCMKRRNAELVRLGDIIIAYMGRERSGAGQTVRMARRAGKRVYNLYPRLNSTT